MTGSLPPFAASRIAAEAKQARRTLEPGLWVSPVNWIRRLVWDREQGWWRAHMASGGVMVQSSFPLGLHVCETAGEEQLSRYRLVAWPPPPDSDPCAGPGHVWVDVCEVDGGILRRCDVCEDELVEHPDGTVTPVRKAGE